MPVVWITGASSGIGAALAEAWAAPGVTLLLSGRREDALAAVAARCAAKGAAAHPLAFEATDLDRLPAVVDRAISLAGPIDTLVNNAGVSQRSLAVDTDLATYRRIMEIDWLAPVALTRLLLPHMIARRSGSIVQIASVAGKVGVPLRTGYCAAKHALIGYSDALRAEVARHNVRVQVVIPGFVRTGIARNALRAGEQPTDGPDPVDSGMDPAEAARQILSGIQRGHPEITVSGPRERAALLLRRLWPALLSRQIALK